MAINHELMMPLRNENYDCKIFSRIFVCDCQKFMLAKISHYAMSC